MILEESKGDYVRMKCPSCGSICEGTVSRVDLLPSRQPHCTVVVRWKAEQATFKELAAVRRLFPELKNEPIQQLRTRIGNAPEWVVGDFLEIVAQRLKREASVLKLDMALGPAAASATS